MASQALAFRKMNGLQNDFVILDGRLAPMRLSSSQITAIANRETGIGCDKLIILESAPEGADIFMRIFNADGSEVAACGNATRCVGKIILDETAQESVTILTKAGLLFATRTSNPHIVSVDMGEPKLKWDQIPLSEEFQDTRTIELEVGPLGAPLIHSPSVVNMGNPHCVFFVDDLDVIDLTKSGFMLEHHPLFPERANISLARVNAKDHITLRVWERGAGITKACGTAACAALVSAVRRRMCERAATVSLEGGDLFVEWRENNHVLQTGAVEDEGVGEISTSLLMGAA